MADYLASIFGTEKDKVNCSFYFKIGACRHGETCSRAHNKPTFSQTILMQNFYENPGHFPDNKMSEEELQRHFENFYQDIFTELVLKYGEIEEIRICDNVGDHLIGNVYVRFRYEEDAEKACEDLNNRFYDGRIIRVELSPVTDFTEACCRQYETGECTRRGLCNFMHLKKVGKGLEEMLFGAQRAYFRSDPSLRERYSTPEPEERDWSPRGRRRYGSPPRRYYDDDRGRGNRRGRGHDDYYRSRDRDRSRERDRDRDREYRERYRD